MEDSIKKFIPGAVSGLASVTLGYPFDTVKTRAQIGNSNNINILKEIIKKEGILTLYRGSLSPLLTITIKRSYQYNLFEHLKEKNLNPFIGGAIAGVSGSLIGCPMHVLKAQMQATTKTEINNTFSLVKKIYHREGIKGFYRGVGINTFKDLIFGGFYLGTYTNLKSIYSDLIFKKSQIELGDHQNKICHFLSGGTAAILTWGTFIPLDHFETAVQTKRGYKYVFEKIRDRGFFVLWKGVTPILLRIFPVSAVSMTAYEYTLSKIKESN